MLDIIASINREVYFDLFYRDDLYGEKLIPIGKGEVSDNPLTLAKMIQLLSPNPEWKILEIGTGSGYSTSILASMVKEVVTIEYHEGLAKESKERVIDQGFFNVKFFAGDATDIKEFSQDYDAIIIFAACYQSPYALFNQLKDEGVAVFPMGPPGQQQITFYTHSKEKESSRFSFSDFCEFKSIYGKYGWL